MLIHDFSYETVFHYLRSGLTGFSTEQVDRLENYVLTLGIRGKSSYSKMFVRMPKGYDAEELEALLTDDDMWSKYHEKAVKRASDFGMEAYVKEIEKLILAERR